MILVCGLDEVGRGAFAGPLVAASVVIHDSISELIQDCPVPIRDSKALSHNQRQQIAHYLVGKNIKSHIEVIPASDINDRGMGWANKEIFIRLIKKTSASRYIVDGNLKLEIEEGIRVKSVIKADTKVPQVTLAGILAKLYRDRLMCELGEHYPQYCWRLNKGYGTLAHRQAITKHGICPEHRTLWVDTWRQKTQS